MSLATMATVFNIPLIRDDLLGSSCGYMVGEVTPAEYLASKITGNVSYISLALISLFNFKDLIMSHEHNIPSKMYLLMWLWLWLDAWMNLRSAGPASIVQHFDVFYSLIRYFPDCGADIMIVISHICIQNNGNVAVHIPVGHFIQGRCWVC